MASLRRARGGWLSLAAIGIGIGVATLAGTAVLLLATVIATFFIGPFSLAIPLGALVMLGVTLTNRGGRHADWCPECGGVLSPAVIELVAADNGELRLRAVYTCAVLEHSSWRWADEGAGLRVLTRPERAQDVGPGAVDDS